MTRSSLVTSQFPDIVRSLVVTSLGSSRDFDKFSLLPSNLLLQLRDDCLLLVRDLPWKLMVTRNDCLSGYCSTENIKEVCVSVTVCIPNQMKKM